MVYLSLAVLYNGSYFIHPFTSSLCNLISLHFGIFDMHSLFQTISTFDIVWFYQTTYIYKNVLYKWGIFKKRVMEKMNK